MVNGKAHFAGSNRVKMNAALENIKNTKAENKVSITRLEREDGVLALDYDLEGAIEGKKLKAVLA